MLLMKFDFFNKKLLPPSSFSLSVVTKDWDLIHDNIYHVCVCVCVCVCARARTRSLSRVRLFATSRTIALQAPLPMGFPRKKYWSGLSFTLRGGLPDPGIKPTSPALVGRFFTTEPSLKPLSLVT